MAIDDEYNKEYRKALYKAQATGDLEQLAQVFKKCQERLDEKLQSYIPTIEQVANEVKQFVKVLIVKVVLMGTELFDNNISVKKLCSH